MTNSYETMLLNRFHNFSFHHCCHNTRSSPYVTLIKPSSSLKVTHRSFRHASPHLWNQLPTSLRIPHPNLLIPVSATFIWTCRFNLLHTAITFHHFFTVSLWARNLPFQKILSSTLVLLGLMCVLPFICLLFPNHTNLNYLNGWELYGEFRYKCNPTRWLRITRQ